MASACGSPESQQKITEAGAAKAIDVARTTIVAVEQGQRRVQYGRNSEACSSFIKRQSMQFLDAKRFTSIWCLASANCLRTLNSAIEHAVRLLNDLVRAEVELENALGIQSHAQLSARKADIAWGCQGAGRAGRSGTAGLAWTRRRFCSWTLLSILDLQLRHPRLP